MHSSEEFILRYKLYSYDSLYGSEYLTFSSLMTPLDDKYKLAYQCKIADDRDLEETTLSFLNKNRDSIVECVLKSGIYLNSKTTTNNQAHKSSSTTILKKPTYFTVEFNEGFAKIRLFEQERK